MGRTEQAESIRLLGGEGIGKQLDAGGKAAIYAYAKRLLLENLSRHLSPGEKISVTLILPKGVNSQNVPLMRLLGLWKGFHC
jgi:cobalt-precorrin-5B (C1)-methyltransferase